MSTSSLISFERLDIHFDTEVLPPPFSYRYRITIKKLGNSTLVSDLDLEYYGRNELSEEEILDEGFSLEDDFKWSGILPQIWSNVIDERLRNSNWKKTNDEQKIESVFYLKVQHSHGAEVLWPAEKKQWETFAQELIQAIFELGKREAPLKIQFQSIDKVMKSISMEYAFSERTIHAESSENRQISINWIEGQKLLKYIFSFDYFPEDSLAMPKKPGNYLCPGDGMWYELNKDKLKGDPQKVQRLLDTMKSFF